MYINDEEAAYLFKTIKMTFPLNQPNAQKNLNDPTFLDSENWSKQRDSRPDPKPIESMGVIP